MKIKNKIAQIKIQEMAFMLIAVVVFFVLVGLFVFSIFYSNLRAEAEEIREARTLSAITNLADSPEFNCGEPNCIDADKLMALTKSEDYEKLWPFSSLIIISQSGFGKDEEDLTECTFGNYPYCDLFFLYDKQVSNERLMSSFVALCRKDNQEGIYDKCEIAKIYAGTRLEEG